MRITGTVTVKQEHSALKISGEKNIDPTMGRSYTTERMKCDESFTFIAPVIKVSSRTESYFASADAVSLRVIDRSYSNLVENADTPIDKVKTHWKYEDETSFRLIVRKPPVMNNVVRPKIKNIVDINGITYVVFQFPKKVDHIKA